MFAYVMTRTWTWIKHCKLFRFYKDYDHMLRFLNTSWSCAETLCLQTCTVSTPTQCNQKRQLADEGELTRASTEDNTAGIQ